MQTKAHWETVYRRKRADEVSWFQREATLSLSLIERVAGSAAVILDVGGGASTLVDGLLRAGHRRLGVLDISRAALQQARHRLGAEAAMVAWLEADVLAAPIRSTSVDLWHDRAVFHFLTAPDDRERYVAEVRRTVRPGGWVLVATFAEDGPSRCSGLDVARYSATGLHDAFGSDFTLVTSSREAHQTPAGSRQVFTYCLCRYVPASSARPAA